MWRQTTLQEQKKREYLKVKINELETNRNTECSFDATMCVFVCVYSLSKQPHIIFVTVFI